MMFTIHAFMGGHWWLLSAPLVKTYISSFTLYLQDYVATWENSYNISEKTTQTLHLIMIWQCKNKYTNKKYTHTHTHRDIAAFFRHGTSGSIGPWSLRETNEKELDHCPDLLLGESFQHQYRKGEPRWSLVVSLNWGGSFVSSGSPRHLELAEKVLGIVWRRKSSKNLQKVLLKCSIQYYSVHMNK